MERRWSLDVAAATSPSPRHRETAISSALEAISPSISSPAAATFAEPAAAEGGSHGEGGGAGDMPRYRRASSFGRRLSVESVLSAAARGGGAAPAPATGLATFASPSWYGGGGAPTQNSGPQQDDSSDLVDDSIRDDFSRRSEEVGDGAGLQEEGWTLGSGFSGGMGRRASLISRVSAVSSAVSSSGSPSEGKIASSKAAAMPAAPPPPPLEVASRLDGLLDATGALLLPPAPPPSDLIDLRSPTTPAVMREVAKIREATPGLTVRQVHRRLVAQGGELLDPAVASASRSKVKKAASKVTKSALRLRHELGTENDTALAEGLAEC